VSELAVGIPAFFLALLIVVNVGMFLAETARFDRVCNEVARSLVTSQQDPAVRAGSLLNTCLGYTGGRKGPFYASVEVQPESEVFLERRLLNFRLRYRLFGTADIAAFSRAKTLEIFWSRGL
jgi:hypothetical protein